MTKEEVIIKETLKELEKEPCDCISRQSVNILVDELARAISDERCCISRGRSTASIMQDILDLPSVQPKVKQGRWKHKCDDRNDWLECPFCGYGDEGEVKMNQGTVFCPFCGARLLRWEEH